MTSLLRTSVRNELSLSKSVLYSRWYNSSATCVRRFFSRGSVLKTSAYCFRIYCIWYEVKYLWRRTHLVDEILILTMPFLFSQGSEGIVCSTSGTLLGPVRFIWQYWAAPAPHRRQTQNPLPTLFNAACPPKNVLCAPKTVFDSCLKWCLTQTFQVSSVSGLNFRFPKMLRELLIAQLSISSLSVYPAIPGQTAHLLVVRSLQRD